MASNNSVGQKLLAFGRGENRVKPSAEKKKKRNEQVLHEGRNRSKLGKTPRGWTLFKRKTKTLGGDDDDFRDVLTKDIAQTSCETWVTFAFTFIVGAFLLGGGIYLIYDGEKNNVVDFIVVGGFGIFMGVCFTSVGSFLVFKPIYQSYEYRKRRKLELWRQMEEEKAKQTVQARSIPFYFTDSQANIMSRQVSSHILDRQPEIDELYGEGIDALPTKPEIAARTRSASSNGSDYELPPPVAIPKKSIGSRVDDEPVMLMEFRQSTDDDIYIISEAAEKKNVIFTQKTVGEAKATQMKPSPLNKVAKPPATQPPTIPEVDPESTPVKSKSGKLVTVVADISPEPPPTPPLPGTIAHERPASQGSQMSSTNSVSVGRSSHEFDGSPLPDIEIFENKDNDRNNNVGIPNGGSRPNTGMDISVPDENITTKERHMLSALNEGTAGSGTEDLPPPPDFLLNPEIEPDTMSEPYQYSPSATLKKPRPAPIDVNVIVNTSG